MDAWRKTMNQFINPIEESLLTDLVSLYSSDLQIQAHTDCHERCSACSKQQIIEVINRHRNLKRSQLIISEPRQ